MHRTLLRVNTCTPLPGRHGLALILAAALMAAAAPALSCPVPVFQYSLEQWEADPYQLIVHHDGPLSESERATVARLTALQSGAGEKANLVVGYRDYSIPEHPPQPAQALPYVEVRYPTTTDRRGALFTVPLEDRAVAALVDSPVRRTLGAFLLERKAAVWILLESGDRTKDQAAWQLLQREVSRLERTLRVPDPDPEWGIRPGEIQTEIDFELLRLSRNNPAEGAFISMLLGTEPDLHQFVNEPIVFIVYGRGLVMYGLVGAGINERTITAAGEFLTGPCSCQIKSGNPGIDLLLSVDWDRKVEKRFELAGPAPGAAGGFLDRRDEADQRLEEQP